MNRTIVITGASEGIGATLAKRLCADGNALVLAARNAEKLKQVASECGENTLVVVTDVTKRADVEHLRDAALERFGQIDVWVNNAGRGIGIRVLDLSEEQLDEMLTVNLKSAWYGMKTIIPYFQSRGQGHLINVSSVLGRVPTATFRSAYSASKAALNSLTANLRMDLRADYPNIYVSLVMPGPVATDFHLNALGGTPGGRGGQQIQTVEPVVDAIVSVIEHPVPEVYTNAASAQLVQNYFGDVAAFEDAWFERMKNQNR